MLIREDQAPHVGSNGDLIQMRSSLQRLTSIREQEQAHSQIIFQAFNQIRPITSEQRHKMHMERISDQPCLSPQPLSMFLQHLQLRFLQLSSITTRQHSSEAEQETLTSC